MSNNTEEFPEVEINFKLPMPMEHEIAETNLQICNDALFSEHDKYYDD